MGEARPAGVHSPRNLNMDLIRVMACFLVISVHFFPNTSFYAQPIVGGPMFALTFIRNFSMSCVPLFMILTGYLSRHFVYDKKHILRFVHILIVLSARLDRLQAVSDVLSGIQFFAQGVDIRAD